MYISVDTDTRGACAVLLGLTLCNISDCLARPELAREVLARFSHPAGCEYRREKPDEWSTAAVEHLRASRGRPLAAIYSSSLCAADGACTGDGDWPGGPWRMDCEEFASMGATAAVLMAMRDPEIAAQLDPIEVAITQPRDRGMAHAYLRTAGAVDDQAVRYGMRRPADVAGRSWYDQGETAAMRVFVPEFSIWRPR